VRRPTFYRGSAGSLALVVACLTLAGCGASRPPAEEAAPAVAGANMDMLQMMRAFPFPHANVIFDTQTKSPEGQEAKTSMSFSVYRWGDADTYAGWAGVENSALALTELSPILLAPRVCSNGRPAPVDREDWKKAVEGVVAAGVAAHKAALTRNMDAMIETSETLTNACAACHDVYRDVDLEGGERCTVPTE
jgi:hypothetical protein